MSGLSCTHLSFGYAPGRPVLREVSASVPAGSLTAIIGPNGAGKSTLLKLLLGLRRPWSGSVTLDGREVLEIPSAERVRRLAYIPGHAESAFPFTVRQIVLMGAEAVGAASRRADEAIESVGLSGHAGAPIGTLSAGERQRAIFARAIVQLAARTASGSAVLLADEPTASMDPRHALSTLGRLRTLAREGAAVGLVLHDLTAAARFADRVIILSAAGQIVAEGDSAAILSPANLQSLFGVPFLRMHAPDGSPVIAVGAQEEIAKP